jgi:CBS domain containing-hemolysin-like protein
LMMLGRPPIVGDVVLHQRVRIEVTATSGRGVREARVTVLPDRSHADG